MTAISTGAAAPATRSVTALLLQWMRSSGSSADPRGRATACVRALAALGTLVLAATSAHAQDLEPRTYSNAPVGLNFLIVGYAHSEGGLSTDPALPIEDAELRLDTGILAYAQSLDWWGKPGKFDVVTAYSDLSGSALVAGEPITRAVDGFSDPRFRLSVILYGAPALSLQEFAGYKQDTLIGASVQVSVPVGQYDPSRAVNLGTNRWSVKPEVGVSKALGSLTLELTGSVTFYSTNDDYFGGKIRQQDPLYSTQAHVIYSFGRGIWAALNATYYWGGRTTIDGVAGDTRLGNSRVGATLTLPVNRLHSIKLYASTGVSTRTGTDFDTAGLAWQYRWGAGL